ncbi:MAG: LysM peptidoglycan-binding domain-containing protein [Anaerolineales bacterium]|nr:LysM peptidoglycan-binding domain-containing protein [Anaerolineales bacterium]
MGVLARMILAGNNSAASLATGRGQPLKLRIHPRQVIGLLAVLGCFVLALVDARLASFPARTPAAQSLWSVKPVLGYFALTASLIETMQSQADLTDAQVAVIQRAARSEVEQLRALEESSNAYVMDPTLSLEQKRARIAEMGYNRQVLGISRVSQRYLQLVLPRKAFNRLAAWMEARWEIERALHGTAKKPAAARSYEIYATRYDSKGAYYVALPDQCVKFTNGGNRICESDGYVVGQKYDVYVSYKKGVAARVGESGPWNVDDTYWATFGDPTPRRMFADLPLGMPEAQAAYFNGYNGGVDQYGRKVTAPYGIDLARQVSIDIGLEPGNNDWIQVTFLWTEGWGQSSVAPIPKDPAADSPQATRAAAAPASSVTQQADGSRVLVVQPNQTLWEIAATHNLTLQELLDLNNLTKDSLIRPGDKLIVREARPGLIQTQTAAAAFPKDTPRPARQPGKSITPTRAYSTQAPQAAYQQTQAAQKKTPPSSSLFRGANATLAFSAAVIVAGVLFLLVGALLNRLGK